jgi:putative ABC transport system permease protein
MNPTEEKQPMLKNYFKIALRNITRKKAYTAINILGLALGICACIVIYVISSYELSFDNFHPHKDRIYRVMGDVTENTGNKLHYGRLPAGVSLNGRTELSGIDGISGVIPYNTGISIPDGDKSIKHFESKIGGTNYITTVITQPQYFDIFKYKWLAGNVAISLSAPFKVVLTESRAHQYFGNAPLNEIVGKQIVYDDSLTVTVSGIIADWNKNTDLAFTDFISSATLETSFFKNRINTDSWEEHFMNTWTFVKLSSGVSLAKLSDQLNALVKSHTAPDIKLVLWLEPLSDIHFNPNVIENMIRTADKTTLYSLITIALFILILALINFINLSTAQSIQRAKEVGVRKVLGSSRGSLVFQFLTETFVLTLFAVSLAVSLVNPTLALFHSYIPGGVTFHFFEPSTIIFLVLVTLITSVLAGLYPAKVLSSYLPVLSLKGAGTQRGSEKWFLRKALIIFQFSVSLVFIIGSIVITSQLKYTRDKDPGFSSDAIVVLPTPWNDSLSKLPVLAEKIKKLPGVSNVAIQWLSPMTNNGRVMQLKFNSTDRKEIEVGQVAGNENFIPVYNIKLLTGRNLTHADSVKEFIINETFLKHIGYKKPADAIGKILYWNDKPFPIVGVVADFHTASFHDPISPLCIINRPDREHTLAVKLASKGGQASSIKATLLQLEKEWKQMYPAETFKYEFYDESLALLYEKDEQTATLINTAMATTILISCIGLFGLILFTAEKRAKEISVRKILGAGVGNILILLSNDFVMLVLIALLLASPVAWYFMNQWLQGFAYRINISGWIFVVAGITAILIALVTISFHTIKAALLNPIKNLRNE